VSDSLLPFPDPDRIALTYGGIDVMFNEDRLVNMTQMYEAAGKPAGKEPATWRRRDDATSFISDLTSKLNVRQSHILTSMRGKGGATWAHWQVALAYAKYLSNEFHFFVNEAFKEWAEEKANPDLKADRAIAGYRRHGRGDAWISARIEGKLVRRELTDCLKEHQVEGAGYALCTDSINVPVLGGTAKEVKERMGLPARVPLRDRLKVSELAGLRFAELLAEEQIVEEQASGNAECADVCLRAGKAVGEAFQSVKKKDQP
jgi:hypothetical protein